MSRDQHTPSDRPDVGAELPDFLAYHAQASAKRLAAYELASGARLTYAELDRRVARCAGLLTELLAEPFGKRVALLGRNSLDLVTLHFACARLGAIFQPLNWRLSGPELRTLVEDAGPGLFVYAEEFRAAADDALRGTGIRHTLVMGARRNELADAIAAARPVGPAAVAPEAPVTLLYTSGTTGRPKGVVWTRRGSGFGALNFVFASQVCAGDVLLCDVPMFHVSGLSAMTRGALCAGATLVISEDFDPSRALALLSDPALGASHYFAVPRMAQALRADPAYAESDLTRLKALVVGGGPVPPTLVEQFLADGVPLVDGYGLSEAGTVFGMPPDRDTMARKAGTSGVPAPWIQVRLVDRAGHEVGPGETGEIQLRGPSVTPGYWQRPEASAAALQDGWLRTGDAAVRDADGFYRLVDRWKDMYITGGENVYPAEVEAVLLDLPQVAEAAVIGVPDPKWGEAGCAYVVRVPEPAAEATGADEILAHCRARLARYKIPREVHFVRALPRTGSGKVRKALLRQRHAGGDAPAD